MHVICDRNLTAENERSRAATRPSLHGITKRIHTLHKLLNKSATLRQLLSNGATLFERLEGVFKHAEDFHCSMHLVFAKFYDTCSQYQRCRNILSAAKLIKP